jgi:hypothetical protein
MVAISRMVLSWTGPQVVGGGVSVLHFSGTIGTTELTAVQASFNAVKSLLTSSTVVSFPSGGDVLDDVTGIVSSAWSGTPPASITGTGNANAFNGAGVCVTWNTSTVHGRRLIRGRTFLVPSPTSVADVTGFLTTAGYTTLNAFGASMAAITNFGVWHRPPPHTGTGGLFATVTGFHAKNKVAMLTSRRD